MLSKIHEVCYLVGMSSNAIIKGELTDLILSNSAFQKKVNWLASVSSKLFR